MAIELAMIYLVAVGVAMSTWCVRGWRPEPLPSPGIVVLWLAGGP
jgi:hypothetical protein